MKKVEFKTLGVVVSFAAVLALSACSNKKAEDKIADSKEISSSTAAAVPAENTAGPAKPDGPLAAITFTETEFNFGTVNEGQVIEHTFNFTNTGEAPLVIQNAQPSCGCTVPDWTKEPIPVGGKGFVKAKFDSNGRSGMNNKTITVVANSWPAETKLKFTVQVTPKPQMPQQPDAGPLKQ